MITLPKESVAEILNWVHWSRRRPGKSVMVLVQTTTDEHPVPVYHLGENKWQLSNEIERRTYQDKDILCWAEWPFGPRDLPPSSEGVETFTPLPKDHKPPSPPNFERRFHKLRRAFKAGNLPRSLSADEWKMVEQWRIEKEYHEIFG